VGGGKDETGVAVDERGKGGLRVLFYKGIKEFGFAHTP